MHQVVELQKETRKGVIIDSNMGQNLSTKLVKQTLQMSVDGMSRNTNLDILRIVKKDIAKIFKRKITREGS